MTLRAIKSFLLGALIAFLFAPFLSLSFEALRIGNVRDSVYVKAASFTNSPHLVGGWTEIILWTAALTALFFMTSMLRALIWPSLALYNETGAMRFAKYLAYKFYLLVFSYHAISYMLYRMGVAETYYQDEGYWWTLAVPALILSLCIGALINSQSDKIARFIRILESRRFGRGGSGRFAGMFEEMAAEFSPSIKTTKTRLYFGNSLYIPWMQIGWADDQHMITFADTRAGKGVSAIIPNLLSWPHSALVIDPKGTNTHVTAQRRRDMGHNVHIFDPFKIVTDKGASFNSLADLDLSNDDIVEELTGQTSAIVLGSRTDRNAHFVESADLVIAGTTVQVCSDPTIKNPSYLTVREKLLLTGPEQDDFLANMMMNDACGGLARDAAKKLLETRGTTEGASILSTVSTQLKWLASQAVGSSLSESTFSFSEMREKPTTIYVVIPPKYIRDHPRFLRLLITQAMAQFTTGGKSPVPALFMVDEANSLGRFDMLARAYSELAGYGMVVWTFWQNLGQLTKLYGEEKSSFLGGSRAVQVFGINDPETLDYVSKSLGRSALNDPTEMRGGTEILNLRDPEDVAKEIGAEGKRMYLLRAGKVAMILRRVPYFESVSWRSLASDDPDYHTEPRMIDKVVEFFENPSENMQHVIQTSWCFEWLRNSHWSSRRTYSRENARRRDKAYGLAMLTILPLYLITLSASVFLSILVGAIIPLAIFLIARRIYQDNGMDEEYSLDNYTTYQIFLTDVSMLSVISFPSILFLIGGFYAMMLFV